MEQNAIFAIISLMIVSFTYFFILELIKRDKREKTKSRMIFLYIVRKLSGFLLLGVIPVSVGWIFLRIDSLHLQMDMAAGAGLFLLMTGASLLFILLNFFNSKNKELQSVYPELHINGWNIQMIIISSVGWVVYLVGYEALFRGLVLFTCLDAFGLWPAVVINLALYSALHLPKGMKEAVGAIPFGALLCYLTIETGSIFPAIFLHSIQAISCEIFCIYRNPEMNFHLKNL